MASELLTKLTKTNPIGRGVKTTGRPIDELLCLHTIDISVEIEKSAKSVESLSSWDSERLVSSIEQDERYIWEFHLLDTSVFF